MKDCFKEIMQKSAPTNLSFYPDQPQVAVGAIVFKDDKVLLVLRANPPAKEQWAIPGGRVELGETLQEAAEREIKEETGITIRAREPVLTFDVIDRDDAEHVRFHYVIVDLAADYISGEPQPGDDAASARWISPEELNTLPVSPTTLKLLRQHYNFGT
jgi:8-oxo-dGTP diphosphatase